MEGTLVLKNWLRGRLRSVLIGGMPAPGRGGGGCKAGRRESLAVAQARAGLELVTPYAHTQRLDWECSHPMHTPNGWIGNVHTLCTHPTAGLGMFTPDAHTQPGPLLRASARREKDLLRGILAVGRCVCRKWSGSIGRRGMPRRGRGLEPHRRMGAVQREACIGHRAVNNGTLLARPAYPDPSP
eukprot:scaffold4551_cov108-Isochrysis_galbana.AAC.1